MVMTIVCLETYSLSQCTAYTGADIIMTTIHRETYSLFQCRYDFDNSLSRNGQPVVAQT